MTRARRGGRRDSPPALPSQVLEGDPPLALESRSHQPIRVAPIPVLAPCLYRRDPRGPVHRNDRVGEVAVHFPRFAYRIRPLATDKTRLASTLLVLHQKV